MKVLAICVSIAVMLLSACAPTPQNAEEFRRYASNSTTFLAVETFEVDRPYADVAATLQKKSEECLNNIVEHTTCRGTSCTKQRTTYNPTVLRDKERTELHVRAVMKGAVHLGGKPPEGGTYVIVADASPIADNRTQIDIYRMKMLFTSTYKAIQNWAYGTNLGCPDLTLD